MTGTLPPRRRNRFELSDELIDALSDAPRLIVVDEAQWLNRECIEYLRHLHDHPDKPANDAGAAALRRMTDPALAALGALTACTPLDSQHLAGLRLHFVDDQGEHVTLGRVSHDVPVAMRGLLRAQLLYRAGQGATADEEPLRRPRRRTVHAAAHPRSRP